MDHLTGTLNKLNSQSSPKKKDDNTALEAIKSLKTDLHTLNTIHLPNITVDEVTINALRRLDDALHKVNVGTRQNNKLAKDIAKEKKTLQQYLDNYNALMIRLNSPLNVIEDPWKDVLD